MGLWRWRSSAVLAASLLFQQGCLFKKPPRKATIPVPPAPQTGPPPMMAAPPQLAPPEVPVSVHTAEELPTLPPPIEAPKPAKPRPIRRPAPTIANGVGTAPVVAPPTLQPILGSQEMVDRNRRINLYLEKARNMILRAERANPSGGEKELIAQVRTFAQQAEEARRVDLVRAENLAERAEVLSRGLAK